MQRSHVLIPCLGALVTLAAVGLLTPRAAGQADDCEPGWLPTFGAKPGLNSYVNAVVEFDDGTGPALYAAGFFSTAGSTSASRIAKWDGTGWSPLDTGMDGAVYALAVYDNPFIGGPALYAGGSFTTAGGVPASRIAKWDGTSWSALNDGVNGTVRALAVFHDSGGAALCVGGEFTNASGVGANRIARWSTTGGWSLMHSGMNGSVLALAEWDDGGGPALYAGGSFNLAGGLTAKRIAKWDGLHWSPVGGGVDGGMSEVQALAVFDDGSGPALHAGGNFTGAGGVTMARHVAKWDGTSWWHLDGGMNERVHALTVFDDGTGPALYAGGAFTLAGGVPVGRIAKWDSSGWSPLGGGTSLPVRALCTFDDGSGPALFAGGEFLVAGGLVSNYLARWDGASWSALGSGLDGKVNAFVAFDDGSGEALYAGGTFTHVNGLPLKYVARWDGTSWSALGGGLSNEVLTLAVFDDGGGPALYAGGKFLNAGGVPEADRVARWDGTSWSALGIGMNTWVYALASFDDGTGPALYAGGLFTQAGGGTAHGAARWDGSAWSPLGDLDQAVWDLAVVDHGSGPVLYAGGDFTIADNEVVNFVARWDGGLWMPLADGLGDWVDCLAAFDDGSGAALYAGGNFLTASGEPAERLARWDGAAWSPVGGGLDGAVSSLEVWDDGSGPALHVGGDFLAAGGAPATRIAKWDGAAWSPLGGGMSGIVNALLGFDDGSGSALYAGGEFVTAWDSGDSYLAKWAGCPVEPSPWSNLGFALPGAGGAPLLVGVGDLTAGSAGTLALSNAAPAAPALLVLSLSGTLTPFKCGTLVPVPVLLSLMLGTDGSGGIPIAWAAWPAGLEGFSLYFQYAVQDATAICSASLSNALRANVP
jgi:trimeric autotransporter adhesin